LLLWAKSVAGLVVVVYNNNFKQVLTLYPHKIKNTSATQMRGFKDYYFISLLHRFHRLAMTTAWIPAYAGMTECVEICGLLRKLVVLSQE
jgi:hypothetical protein